MEENICKCCSSISDQYDFGIFVKGSEYAYGVPCYDDPFYDSTVLRGMKFCPMCGRELPRISLEK